MSFNSNDAIVSQVYCSVLCTVSPSYEYTDMILTDVFPYDISYNSIGSTKFSTDVVVVDSGNDQRIQRWSQPLMEYDVSYGVRTMEQLQALVSFFRAMRGRLYAFNYFDNIDGSSSTAVVYEARAAPAPTPFDQVIGIGDGNTYVFQLQKTYTSPNSGTTQVRPITRVVPGTTGVGVGGVVYHEASVDNTTGLVTLYPPVSTTLSHSVSKDAQTGSYGTNITGEPGDFTAFQPYANNGHRCIVSGFANGVNNAPMTAAAGIDLVQGDGSGMRLTYPTDGPGGSIAETLASGATFSVHPAPASGVQITAGFQFYVPVRFDTDVLPMTLEDYGVGSVNSIKLVEVRPSAF